jgi:peptide/nickel transport system permease protein
MSGDAPNATDGAQPTFDTLDWDARDRSGERARRRVPWRTLAILLWAFALAVDFFVLPADTPTLPFWDVTGVDWLFLLTLEVLVIVVAVPLYQNPRLTRQYWQEFRSNRAAVISGWFLIATFAVGLVGPILLDRPRLSLAQASQAPVFMGGSWAHPFGTDVQGRDLGVLIVYGMRISMEVGLIATLLAVTIGTLVGTTAAYFGGLVDEALMRYVDLQQSFPTFILLVLLVYLYGGSLVLVIGLFGLFSWEGTARLVRSEALQRSEEAYVEAARAAGASKRWVITRHLVPNVSSTVITVATLQIPGFILGEAALSFLGLGDPEAFSWGRIIASGRGELASAPWISTIPGLFLFLTVLAFNFVGDALRDAIDPRGS